MLPNKPKKIRPIYLDHAATTPVDKTVLKTMQRFFMKSFGNPSALYQKGVHAKQAIETTREQIASLLDTQIDTIFFVPGGTASCNAAILGTARRHANHGKHIITTRVEHKAVLGPMKQLEKEGFDITYIDVDETGNIMVEDVMKAVREDTILISIMYVNNEIGTIYPLADIGREILKWRKKTESQYPLFHTDACQAGLEALRVEPLHVDFMSMNASKIYGPKGIGFLYKRRGAEISPIIYGGGQEDHVWSGTPNVPAIAGLGQALTQIQNKKDKMRKHIEKVRNYFWKQLQEKVPNVLLNGPALAENRAVSNLHVYFKDVDAETAVLYLDEYGIAAGTGSACDTDNTRPSHVLAACGMDKECMMQSIRFTLGKHTTKKDIDYVMKYLPGIIHVLRETKKMS